MLAAAIYEACSADGDPVARVRQAAVLAWYEGHVAAEGEPTPGEDGDHPLPSPPFPDRHDEQLHSIVQDTARQFSDPALVPAAAAYAAGLAYAAGYAAGKTCPGCSYRGRDARTAARIRAGDQPVCLAGGAVGVGIPAFGGELRRGVTSLARRLWAAWLSARRGLKGVDYILDQVGDEEPTEFWLSLASNLQAQLDESYAEFVDRDGE